MVLSELELKDLKLDIKLAVENIPKIVAFARNEETRKKLMLNNDFDFVMGDVIGGLFRRFTETYVREHGTAVQSEDLSEATGIIMDAVPDFRNAILDCG